ncbi:MAG TPA: radical SAM family heme chaperone HemW [Candidatus Kapabacteria bacterium]|nr:radical SAM family heme chaperone HemW [Candidatus Kapabacteria bacterium]
MAGLYIHIPFCERKCIYCNFYSIEVHDGKERFLRMLEREIELRADTLRAEGVEPVVYRTLFLGGGTPSLLSPDEIERIVRTLRQHFPLAADAEITMECNPGALDPGWLRGYRELGVNRLSFGVQSFHDDDLRFLSRIHTAQEARSGIALAREHFENVSLDLIFALPNQTRERWRASLNEGVRLGTDHISAYALVFEEGTKLNTLRLAGSVQPVNDGLEADMYCETMETLALHGFHQYEVSNYARPGRECRHNVGYWERHTYIAFGPSAHAFLRTHSRSTRWANVSNLSAYLDALDAGRLPVASSEIVTPGLALEEIVFLGLRSGGIIIDEFRAVAGADLAQVAARRVAWLIEGGYATLDHERLRLTRRGYPFADRFALELIADLEAVLPEVMASGTGQQNVMLPVLKNA